MILTLYLCCILLCSTYDRYKYGLDFLHREFTSSSGTGISSRLLRVLYGDIEPVSSTRRTQWIPFSQTLNASQKEAVQNALDANDVFLIHGPPGTGQYCSQRIHSNAQCNAQCSMSVPR
jgi:hypothetical protein